MMKLMNRLKQWKSKVRSEYQIATTDELHANNDMLAKLNEHKDQTVVVASKPLFRIFNRRFMKVGYKWYK